MITNENDNSGELDYEGMYDGLSKEKRKYKEHLNAVIIGCTTLETSINNLVRLQAKKLFSKSLTEWNNQPFVPISAKIKSLRFANLIDEKLYTILCTLFKIRNGFTHKILLFPDHANAEFKSLDDVNIESDFVKNLPNDSVKFQLISSYCFTKMLYISIEMDPNSVSYFEADEDYSFTPIED